MKLTIKKVVSYQLGYAAHDKIGGDTIVSNFIPL